MTEITFRLLNPHGRGVAGASVLLSYLNGTYRTDRTGANGACTFDLYRTDQPMTVLAAAEDCLPLRETVQLEGASSVELTMMPSVNRRQSLLFTKSTGYIPGVEGRLNPINECGRTYVYADNIAVNGQVANPAQLEIDEPLQLLDAYGVETEVRFLEIGPQFSLLEYTEPRPYGEQ